MNEGCGNDGDRQKPWIVQGDREPRKAVERRLHEGQTAFTADNVWSTRGSKDHDTLYRTVNCIAALPDLRPGP